MRKYVPSLVLLFALTCVPAVRTVAARQGGLSPVAVGGRVIFARTALAGVRVRLVSASATAMDETDRKTTTNTQGDFSFNDVADGRYRLIVTGVCGEKTVEMTVVGGVAEPIEVHMCLACDNEDGPDTMLTDSDRAVIYSDLVQRALSESRSRVFELRNVNSLQIRGTIPTGVEILRTDQIQARSRKQTVDYVLLDELTVHGRCVRGSYTVACMARGSGCTLGGSFATFEYRYRDGCWQPKWTGGWEARSPNTDVDRVVSEARTAEALVLFAPLPGDFVSGGLNSDCG